MKRGESVQSMDLKTGYPYVSRIGPQLCKKTKDYLKMNQRLINKSRKHQTLPVRRHMVQVYLGQCGSVLTVCQNEIKNTGGKNSQVMGQFGHDSVFPHQSPTSKDNKKTDTRGTASYVRVCAQADFLKNPPGAVAQACNPSTSWITRSRDRDHPGQHGETPSLLKMQKLSWARWCMPVNPSYSGG